jgi:Domain of unknown function (DUF5655)/Domain of unknown function (DUF4287)
MPRAKTANPYSVHPGVLMTQAWVQTLPEKTGRSLEEWIRLVQDEGPATEPERRDWLKVTHKLGTNSASWIAERSVGKGEETGDPQAYLKAAPGYVDAMLAGPKAALRPIYEALLDLGLAVGPDAKACPGETIVPLYRNHVFAQIKPTTKTRIDFGLALKDTPATGRLIDTGGYAKKDRITHRFAITTLAEIDDEVLRWLKKAYEMDA